MTGIKAFIGYDLGDGETITDMAVLNADQVNDRVQTDFTAMTMPDCNDPGKAIPSVYGYDMEGNLAFANYIQSVPDEIRDVRINFKRCPSDLMPRLSEQRKQEIMTLLKDGWPDADACPELNSKKMREFCEAVVCFTNGIFTDESYQERVRSAAVGSEELVFSVGHPTRWSDFDVAVYAGVLRRSILGTGAYLGYPTTMVMAAESRAAFLYVRDKATFQALPKGSCALLIDVGSSTIDLTAMTEDSRNHQYNSGSNYLGARSIDFIIRKWYLNKLQQDPLDWAVYQSLVEMNPAIDQALILSCRMAKETLYSVNSGVAKISFANFRPMVIKRADVNRMIDETSVGEILRSHVSIPEKVAIGMGDKSWKTLFAEFLQERKAEMTAQNLTIGRIIMTGSASKMPFVTEIVAEVFHEIPRESLLSDMNPSRSISMGLALVGPSNEKSKEFQQDLEAVVNEELPKIIDADLPKLAEDIASVIGKRVTGIVQRNMQAWRSSRIDTLEDMTAQIKRDCSEEKLNQMLKDDPEYNAAIENWTSDVVGPDIALKLKSLCDRYGVKNVSLESLNALKLGSVKIGAISMDPTKDLASILTGTISLIAGIVAAIILPTVIGVVIGLVSYLSVGLAIFLLEILLLIPGVGWAILLGAAGIAVVKAAASGMAGAKKMLADYLQKIKLPQWVRDRMTDEKLMEEIRKADLPKQIKESILDNKTKEQIVASVTESVRVQVMKRAEDIKYVIESK